MITIKYYFSIVLLIETLFPKRSSGNYVNTEEDCWKLFKVYSPSLYPEYQKKIIPPKKPGSLRIFLSANNVSSRFSNSAYQFNAAAASMAFIEFCRLGLNSGMVNQTFEFIVKNDGCNSKIGVPAVIDMVESEADVIFGLTCSDVSIHGGYLLSHWNVPAISYGATNAALDDKDIYNILIRMGHMLKFVGESFMQVILTFKWQTFSMITSLEEWYCENGATHTYNSAKQYRNITIAENVKVEGTPTDEQLLTYLKNFRDRARVLLICLEPHDMTRLLEIAYNEDMVNSDYVYFSIQARPNSFTYEPWGDLNGLGTLAAEKRRAAFAHLKMMTFPVTNSPLNLQFKRRVEQKMSQYPWFDDTAKNIQITDESTSSLLLYDIMWFYLQFVNSTMSEGLDPRNGTLLFTKARKYTSEGISGEINMDQLADRIPNYKLWQVKPGDKQFTSYGKFTTSYGVQKIVLTEPPYWGTPNGEPPLNEPECGYRNERCPPSHKGRDAALAGGFTCLAIVIITTFAAISYYRKKKFEEDLQKMTWKIVHKDIKFSVKAAGGSQIGMSLMSLKSSQSKSVISNSYSDQLHGFRDKEQIFTKVGIYKGAMVAIKTLTKSSCKLTRAELVELKWLRDADHENINNFIGACIKPPNIHILTSYCAKGSLQDILEHDEIKLDWMFKCSLVYDLVNGVEYIHKSPLVSHGCLSSSNCLIDSRWVLKIGHVGLQSVHRDRIKVENDVGQYERYKKELWTAPELLRLELSQRPLKGNSYADIYSLAIILQEILYRGLPYFMEDLWPKDIIENVKKFQHPPFRPQIHGRDREVDSKMIAIMEDCWNEFPEDRPDICRVKKRITQMNNGKKINILDNMVQKLERYANNLESIVEKRTEELLVEKKKTDSLLYRMLPSVVAEKLKHGLSVQAEIYESVSIYFSDIVGFTTISSESSPMEVVDLLNDLYTLFDDVIERYDVYKVETIGDAYMCASGCPIRNGDKHATEIANMSLSIRDCVRKFTIRHIPDRKLMIRIGMHSGSCAAGVVGLTMPRYCLFGDTVNVASRMESNGEAMKIHLSQESYQALSLADTDYIIACRGQVELKGKGSITSYWLEDHALKVGKKDS